MFAAALLLTAVTAADQGPVAVVVSSKRAGAEALAPKLAAKVNSTLSAASTELKPIDDAAAVKLLKKAGVDARGCQGGTECLVKAAAALGPKAIVIGVDVGKIGKQLAVHLEAVAADGKEPLAVADFAPSADAWADQAAEPIAAFVKQLTDKLAAAAAPVAKKDEIKAMPADGPVEANLEPPAAPAPAPAVTASRSSGGTRILPIITLGVAAGSLIASGVFLVLGLSEKGIVDRSLMNNGTTSELTRAQFNGHQSRGNLYFSLSLSTAVVGLLLAATGIVIAMN